VSDFLEASSMVDPEAQQNDSGGQQFPLIQYINGNPSNSALGDNDPGYTGGWFIAEDATVEDMPKNWVPYDLQHSDGSSTNGWVCRDITVVIIKQRRRWQKREDGRLIWSP